MNIEELLQIVNTEGLDAPVIYGEGSLRSDAVVLERDGDVWKVYVADERGGMYESTFREYDNEAEALEHVLLKLRQFKKYNKSLEALASRVKHSKNHVKEQESTLIRPGACEVCSSYWLEYHPDKRPMKIGDSDTFMAEIARCAHCGAYWEIGAFSNPKVISIEQAEKELPDLNALEQKLGINFPSPPNNTGKDQLLSQAIITYLSKGKSSFPKHDEDSVKVLATNAGIDPEMLLDAVRAITMECASIEIDWSNHSLAEGGQEVQRVMAKRHPELEKNAVDALAWMFTYMWR